MNRWKFTGSDGTFYLEHADWVRGLYFPIANEAGYMASISPDGGGDAKTDQNHFLMPPVSSVDLHNSRLKRTAWICAPGLEPWSITGASHNQKSRNNEIHSIEAGLLWHRSIRKAAGGEYEGDVVTFSPTGPEKLEISRLSLRNTGVNDLKISLISVYPLFGRSADSLRDHRHVTSLLNQVQVVPQGMHLEPTMSFDERGHIKNSTVYSVLGLDNNGNYPSGCFPDLDQFIGEPGDAERPRAVYDMEYRRGRLKKAGSRVDGCEAVGALQFPAVRVPPGADYSVYLICGVFDSRAEAHAAAERYCSEEGFTAAWEENKTCWAEKTSPVLCGCNDTQFNQWMRWVSVQPTLRRIYGCSFLPYHDYGRGGRGWRDLWQDCLALLLTEPRDVRSLLLSNFAGVRFDGTNATIIGNNPGSFLADRNNIPRVWMDHGAWPVLAVRLYVDRSGDLIFLTEEQEYFSDALWSRGAERIDTSTDTRLKTIHGDVYTGNVFEHMLLQQLSGFYNVGEHNTLRLEGADWNDGLDMANEKGESVAFSSLYGANLIWLAKAAERLHEGGVKIELAEELLMLLDRYGGNDINYSDPRAKQKLLRVYFNAVKRGPSGEKACMDNGTLAADLREKGEHLLSHIREQEWVECSGGCGWFNGYYDNSGRRVEGEFPGGVRMTLTGQVFSLLSGAASREQVEQVIKAADKYLFDSSVGGYRLNSNFNEVKLDMGRSFGFAYGHKENGAMFSHMAVMYAYALYARRETAAAWKVMSMMYKGALNFDKSRIYPGLPEYFDPLGRGLYCYLTGSASWYLLTLVTRIFGVRGSWGDLVLDPQLMAEQWGSEDSVSISSYFRGNLLKVEYINSRRLEAGKYVVQQVIINGLAVDFSVEMPEEAEGPVTGVRIAAASIPEGETVIKVILAGSSQSTLKPEPREPIGDSYGD